MNTCGNDALREQCSATIGYSGSLTESANDEATDSFTREGSAHLKSKIIRSRLNGSSDMRSYLRAHEYGSSTDGERRDKFCAIKQASKCSKSKLNRIDGIRRGSRSAEATSSTSKGGLTEVPEGDCAQQLKGIANGSSQPPLLYTGDHPVMGNCELDAERLMVEKPPSRECLYGCKDCGSVNEVVAKTNEGAVKTDESALLTFFSSSATADGKCSSVVESQTLQADGTGNDSDSVNCSEFVQSSQPSSSASSEVFDLKAADDFGEGTAPRTEKPSEISSSALPQRAPALLVSAAHLPVIQPTNTLCGGFQWELSMMDVLSEEIWDCHMKLAQTEVTLNRKLHLRDCLYYTICTAFPMCGLYIVGSSLNGFGTNLSDMDLCLMITSEELDQRSEAFMVLSKIRTILEEKSWVLEQMLIPAKVPILRIKFSEPFEDITVDLNANNAVAIRNTHLLCYYSSFDWRVRPLVSIVKEWAKRRDINDANRSSFTSYSLVLMVIHYLQCGVNPPILPSLQQMYKDRFSGDADIRSLDSSQQLEQPLPDQWRVNESSTLGELLIGFLEYYAFKFDYLRDAISVRLGRKVGRAFVAQQRSPFIGKNSINVAQWNCICIEEPFTLMNTAHSVHNEVVFDGIRKAFVDSYKELEANRDLKAFLAAPPICYPLSVLQGSPSPVNALTYAQVVASSPESANEDAASSDEQSAEHGANVASVIGRDRVGEVNEVPKNYFASGLQTAFNPDELYSNHLTPGGILAYDFADKKCSRNPLDVANVNLGTSRIRRALRGVSEASSSIFAQGAVAKVKQETEDAACGIRKLRLNSDIALSGVYAELDSKLVGISKPEASQLLLAKRTTSLR